MKKFVVSLLLGGLVLTGCSSTDTPEKVSDKASTETTEEVQTEFNLGEQIKLGDAIVTVTNVQKTAGSDFDTPQQGNEFVIVTVKIENGGTENVSYNPFDFQMKNSNGQITDQTFTTITNDTSLNSGELAGGGFVEGTIPFEAPIGDAGLQLIYQPNFWDDAETITINLQ